MASPSQEAVAIKSKSNDLLFSKTHVHSEMSQVLLQQSVPTIKKIEPA